MISNVIWASCLTQQSFFSQVQHNLISKVEHLVFCTVFTKILPFLRLILQDCSNPLICDMRGHKILALRRNYTSSPFVWSKGHRKSWSGIWLWDAAAAACTKLTFKWTFPYQFCRWNSGRLITLSSPSTSIDWIKHMFLCRLCT